MVSVLIGIFIVCAGVFIFLYSFEVNEKGIRPLGLFLGILSVWFGFVVIFTSAGCYSTDKPKLKPLTQTQIVDSALDKGLCETRIKDTYYHFKDKEIEKAGSDQFHGTVKDASEQLDSYKNLKQQKDKYKEKCGLNK